MRVASRVRPPARLRKLISGCATQPPRPRTRGEGGATGRRRLRAGLGLLPSLALLSFALASVLAGLRAFFPRAPLLLRARLLPAPLLVAGVSAVGSLLRAAVLPRLGALGALVVAGALLLAIPLLFVTTA